MRILTLVVSGVLVFPIQQAVAWGEEGHSIVAEIAQRRLNTAASNMVSELLGPHNSLASWSSWADGVRSRRPETANWHYVDIPRDSNEYNADRDCADTVKGDCIVKALARARNTLACSTDLDAKRDALRFAVHFVGDIHQPLHAIKEESGGNGLKVQGEIHGATCKSQCQLGTLDSANLHMVWDTTLIRRTVYDWGSYVDRLEQGWLKSEGFQSQVADETPTDWALQSHALALLVWNPTLIASNGTLNDAYYTSVLPILDQQLALGGLRLAHFLNEAAGSGCTGAPFSAVSAAGSDSGVQRHGHVDLAHYQQDQAKVGDSAITYLKERARAVGKPAIVLDIDATSLGAPAIRSTLKLFKTARELGVAVFFMTSRKEGERAVLEKNLKKAGYQGWTQVLMEPGNEAQPPSAADFKAPERAGIVMQGYTIVVNVGNQPSDLAGGYAEKSFLMPQPF